MPSLSRLVGNGGADQVEKMRELRPIRTPLIGLGRQAYDTGTVRSVIIHTLQYSTSLVSKHTPYFCGRRTGSGPRCSSLFSRAGPSLSCVVYLRTGRASNSLLPPVPISPGISASQIQRGGDRQAGRRNTVDRAAPSSPSSPSSPSPLSTCQVAMLGGDKKKLPGTTTSEALCIMLILSRNKVTRQFKNYSISIDFLHFTWEQTRRRMSLNGVRILYMLRSVTATAT